jgi:predicted GNAT family acetyltransferase
VKGGRVLCRLTGKVETIPFTSSKSGNDWSLLMVEVTDNTARHRFEMTVDGKVAFLDYAMEDGRLVLMHTEVPQVLAGRGVGTALVRLVLDEARSGGLWIVPKCEFVETYIRHHPEFADLVGASPA